ncbi:MAG TPA: Smr/MutS family protein [Gammaproteobacteria bacterium]|jgi:DNA-nicking Smr family endonuclease
MPISKEDRRAFAEATRDVKPLERQNRTPLHPRRPKPEAGFSRAAQSATLEDSLNDDRGAQTAEEIAFRRPGVSERNFRDLRRGRFSIEAEIDLHGLTRAQAKSLLHDFIVACAARRLGCIRVVHGKGARSGPDGPVLKASVQHWLSQWDEVLAYVSAGRKHGGSGALYVLLRPR